jgi:ABC-type transporter Mla MlaB component
MKVVAKNAILRIVIQRANYVEKWTLYGSLAGKTADELAASWKNTHRQPEWPECVIDLTDVISVDERGEDVLLEMMRQGAHVVVKGLYLSALLERLTERCKQENEKCGSYELR